MKRLIPWIAFAIALLWVASNSRLPKSAPGAPDLVALGKLPVLSDGRIKPLDTVGRNALLIMHGKQTLRGEGGAVISSTQWLADLLFNAGTADRYPTFVINNPEVLGLFGWEQHDRKHFSFEELQPFLRVIDDQGQTAESVQSANRTAFQKAIHNLRNSLMLYQRIKNSLRPGGLNDFGTEVEEVIKGVSAAAGKLPQKVPQNDPAFLSQFTEQCKEIAEVSYLLPVPPATGGNVPREEWLSVGASLMGSLSTGKLSQVTMDYVLLGDAYAGGNVGGFNAKVRALAGWMAKNEPRAATKTSFEYLFNQLQPFYQAMGLYVLAFLLVCAMCLSGNRSLGTAAFWILLVALAIHTFGLGSRMYLQGRPPVTNLYSSAIFIGWGTVILGLLLERIYRDGIGMACASVIGFTTLIIAHHLAGTGDTLEMLQAVLDTNIWLATHVVTITIGYSAMFFAGTLATIYVVREVFARSLLRESAQGLVRMIYGVICFATLFSFVGTVLGGIWADQSWGRFWGWDPKENGALLIVLWCAITLHARLGGHIRERGLVAMALFGNVVTAFSWFGVNMLGVGLHSYGFMDRAVPWLAAFIGLQMVLIAAVLTPAFGNNPSGRTATPE